MKLTDNDVTKILKLRKRGFKTKDIAMIFGVSQRRIQQILKNPKLKKPGRKPNEISPRLKKKVIQLRKEGYTIKQIHQILGSYGCHISRYKVWKIVREYREIEMREIVNNVKFLINNHKSVILIGTSPLLREGDGLLRLFIILDVSKCHIIYCDVLRRLSLKKIIEIFDFHILRVSKPDFVILSPVPPLVPTNGSENRLTRHLKNLGIPWIWIPEPLKKEYRKEAEKIKNLFRSERSCSLNLINQIERVCERIWGDKDGNIKENKKIPKNQKC